MANLQIKSIDDDLYGEIKKLAARERRSVSQQILFLTKEYLSRRKQIQAARTPAQVLLDLCGSWADDRSAVEITKEIKAARRRSKKMKGGF
jgi:hypothetical protein